MTPLPIACDLAAIPAVDRARYQVVRKQVIAAITNVAETAEGYAVRFENKPGMLATVADWIALEALCCPFLSFELAITSGDPLRLEVGGASGVKDFLREEFAAWLAGRASPEVSP